MRAIILAAGRGKRLAEHNPDDRPKCLLEFGGQSLLGRMLATLAQAGVPAVELVVGYEADRIIDHVGTLAARPDVSFHYNPHYLDGSVVSLATAGAVLRTGETTLVMDADVLFHPDILFRLLRSSHENCYLLDREFEPGDEPVKVAVRDGRMVDFRKRLADDLVCDFVGESVGFFRFAGDGARAVAEACDRYRDEGLADAPHEEALRDVLLAGPEGFGFEDVTGLPWLEIDFVEDIARAHAEILPAVEAATPEPAE